MGTFVNITTSQMESALPGFRELPLRRCSEKVYGKRIDVDGIALTMRVYSGIDKVSGESRSNGSDAIRITIVWKDENGRIRGVARTKRVNRVPGWQNRLQSRIADLTPRSARLQSNGWLKIAA